MCGYNLEALFLTNAFIKSMNLAFFCICFEYGIILKHKTWFLSSKNLSSCKINNKKLKYTYKYYAKLSCMPQFL